MKTNTIVMKPFQTNQSNSTQSNSFQSNTFSSTTPTTTPTTPKQRSFSDGDFVGSTKNDKQTTELSRNESQRNESQRNESQRNESQRNESQRNDKVVVLKPKQTDDDEHEKVFVSKLGRKRDNPVKKHNRGWNNELVRISYFDEREKKTGKTEQPRVVTVVWSYDRTTGLLKYGADVWTSFRTNDVFCKTTERGHALSRYQTEPIVIQFEPGLGTNAEILKNLRWLVYRFGVSNKSPRFLKFSKTFEYTNEHHAN